MEPETLLLILGSQAAAALMVLTATPCALPATARVPSRPNPGIARSAGARLWSGMKQHWLPANGR
jgi:hypothetical protein